MVISGLVLFFRFKNSQQKNRNKSAPVCIFNPGPAGLFRLLCLKLCFFGFHFIILSRILGGVVDVF